MTPQEQINALKEQVETLQRQMREFTNPAQLDPQIIRALREVIGATTLATLSDVSKTAPTNGQVLKYVSGTGLWTPGTDNV